MGLGELLTALGIVVAIGGLYLANRRARKRRISHVVDTYVERCSPPRVIDTGASAFLYAGARKLKNDREVRDAIEQIVSRIGESRHPLEGYREDIPVGVDLKSDVVDRLNEDGSNLSEICQELAAEAE